MDEFYARVNSKHAKGDRVTFSFTSRQLIDESYVTVLLFNPFLPKIKTITKDVLGDINDPTYKIIWTFNMTLSKPNWTKFSELTHKMSIYFTCETRDVLSGERTIAPLFQIGKMMKRGWEYSLENNDVGHVFTWGSIKVIILPDEVLFRLVIEDAYSGEVR